MIEIKRLKSGAHGFDAQLSALLEFEGAQDPAIDAAVAGILDDVKRRGDAAVLEYTRRFGGVARGTTQRARAGRGARAFISREAARSIVELHRRGWHAPRPAGDRS